MLRHALASALALVCLDRACTPMPIPKEFIDMLGDVVASVINHEAGAL